MDEVVNYLKTLRFMSDYVIAAISGGPDSMALLDILIKLKSEYNLKIVCAHVNHKKRLQSEMEAIKLKDYCNKNNVVFEYMEITKYTEKNFENEAREIRYQFFEKLIKKYNSKYLFTAHHGDDLIETILMRIVRGSNLNGYTGFTRCSKRKNYSIVRPLIRLTKSCLLDYVNDNNIWYAVDDTNFDDIHTRNRYRKYVLPVLKKEDANVHIKFNQFSNEINECNEFIKKYAKNKYNKIVNNDKIDINLYLKEDLIIQKYILYIMLERLYDFDIKLINNRHISNMLNLIKNTSSNKSVDLPNNFKGIKEYNDFYISSLNDIKDYEYIFDESIDLLNDKSIKKILKSEEKTNNIIYLNSKEIRLPLKIRNRRNGDRISVKNMKGTKKVNDIFIDCKISRFKRDYWPIVVDSNNTILWIPGLKKSNFDRQKSGKYDIILKYT